MLTNMKYHKKLSEIIVAHPELVSIVIPIYNAAKYISQCFNSLFAQSYVHWEAICIDDGSTDNSLELIQNFALKDNRIKVFSQDNMGAAKARELGLSQVQGDYVTFLDIDDTFSDNALEVMVNAFEDNTDLVVSGFNIIRNGKVEAIKKMRFCRLSKIEYLKQVLCGKCGWELWAKMYRKHLFENQIETPDGFRAGEDAAVFIQLVSLSNEVKIIPELVYNYMQYDSSISHVKSLKYAEETLQAAFFIENFLKATPFYCDIKKDIDVLFLLSYSNSSRKGCLGRDNAYVKRIRDEHFRISSFIKMPFIKAIYVILFYCLGELVYKIPLIKERLQS